MLEEEEKYTLPPDFLMEMMDLNELMMEAKLDEDAASTAKIIKAIADMQNEIFMPVKDIVENYQDGVTTTEDLLKVKEYYYKKNISTGFWLQCNDDLLLQPEREIE